VGDHSDFPLVTGRLSLDLVNTEVVRWGKRIDLLVTPDDLARWAQAAEQAGGLNRESLPRGFDSAAALDSMRSLRALLREGFETAASGASCSKTELVQRWTAPLEALIRKAPVAYKVAGNSLVPLPQGDPSDALASLTAIDALRLVATGEFNKVRRCANPDCVLLFLDSSGRRKWCSMKLCGNRMKVARHQHRKGRERPE